ncbi:hypothetical protein JCM10296v2_004495 [Rhodotorula toruloides]
MSTAIDSPDKAARALSELLRLYLKIAPAPLSRRTWSDPGPRRSIARLSAVTIVRTGQPSASPSDSSAPPQPGSSSASSAPLTLNSLWTAPASASIGGSASSRAKDKASTSAAMQQITPTPTDNSRKSRKAMPKIEPETRTYETLPDNWTEKDLASHQVRPLAGVGQFGHNPHNAVNKVIVCGVCKLAGRKSLGKAKNADGTERNHFHKLIGHLEGHCGIYNFYCECGKGVTLKQNLKQHRTPWTRCPLRKKLYEHGFATVDGDAIGNYDIDVVDHQVGVDPESKKKGKSKTAALSKKGGGSSKKVDGKTSNLPAATSTASSGMNKVGATTSKIIDFLRPASSSSHPSNQAGVALQPASTSSSSLEPFITTAARISAATLPSASAA